MTNEFAVVISTTDSKEEAAKLAELAVTEGLAACVQVLPISSTYVWEGKLENSEELLMLFKTTSALSERLTRAIEDKHSYDTPEVIVVPIAGGSRAYFDWVTEVTRHD